MKLYSVDLSPYAARVRMAIYAKGLDIEILPPDGGTKSPEYLALNPIGKVPALETDAGDCVVESETILEYLEDKFPTPTLRGATAEATARMRQIARVAELYVGPHMQVLFGQLNPATRDQAKADEALTKLDEGFGFLDGFLSDSRYAVGDTLSMADCSIAPMMFFVPLIGGALGRGDLLAAHPRLTAYVATLKDDPVYQRIAAEQQRGLVAMRQAG